MEDREQLQLQLRHSPIVQYEKVSKLLVPVSQYGPRYSEQRRKSKDDLKLQRERIQIHLIAEEKKALRLVALQRERENQQLRELRLEEWELARFHSRRRILRSFGWIPWLNLLQLCRAHFQRAAFHAALSMLRRSFSGWRLVLSRELREINLCKRLLRLRADHFRSRWLQRNCWKAWVMLQRAEASYSWALLRSCLSAWKKYCTVGVAVSVASLLKHTWSTWVHHIEELKGATLLKSLTRERLADAHARRVLHKHVLQGWQQETSRSKSEANRIKRHAEAWVKIHSWLEELEQNKGAPTSITRQLLQTGVNAGGCNRDSRLPHLAQQADENS